MNKTIWFVLAVAIVAAFFVARISTVRSQTTVAADDPAYDRSNIIVGEYPNADDVKTLQAHGVKRILTLQDPKGSGEVDDYTREKINANQNAIALDNVPMTAELNCRLDHKYHHQARLAVRDVKSKPDKIYINASMDVRRVAEVERFMHGYGNPTYVPSKEARKSDERVRDSRITLAFYTRHYAEALDLINQGPPPDAWHLTLKGWCEYHLGEIDEAENDFNAAIKKSPRAIEPIDGLGYCELRLGHLDNAEAYFQRALKEDKHDCQALAGMAIVRFRQGRYAEAEHYVRLALAENPDEYDALQIAALLHMQVYTAYHSPSGMHAH